MAADIIDYFDNTIKDSGKISKKYNKAIVGEIQQFGDGRKKKKKNGHKTKVIAVSSANPGEGKSTTAANLAILLAQTGSAVLLTDANMHKPIQHRTFRIKNDEGLSTLIIKKSSMAKSVKSNVINNLDLLPPNPSELLASNSFKALLEQFAINYDYVIIDTSLINVVSHEGLYQRYSACYQVCYDNI